MRDFARLRGGKKQFGMVLALSLVLVTCVGTLLWLIWSEPDGLPASTSEGQSFESEVSSSRSVPSSTAASSAVSESGKSTASGSTVPISRPVQQTGTGTPVQKLQNLTINAALTHDQNATYYNIYINADGVTLKNKLVTGDLVLSESIGNGAVMLENVVVKGRILVNGAQTVALRDVTAVQLIAQRGSGTTDYIFSGASTIHQMTARNQLTIDEGGLSSNYAGVKKLTTERSAPMWQQVTLLKGALEQAITNDATNLVLSGGSSVDSVLANSPTHIGGSGLVYNLTVRSDEVSYEKKPRNITVEGRYSEPNEQNWAIGESETAANGGSHSGTTTRKLATPQNLTMTAATDANSVTLAFDPVGNATGYTVIYSVTQGTNALNATNQTRSVNTNSCVITNALIGQAGTEISFKVRAVGNSSRYAASDYSTLYTQAVVTLGVPTNVGLTLNGDKLQLSFTAAANAAASGHEAVLSVDGSVVATQQLNPGVATCEFTGLVEGKTHTVTVRAVGDGRLTLISGDATATYNVPALPTANGLAIESAGGDLSVVFTGVTGISDYTVTLRYNGGTLDALSHSASGNVYTYLFERPAAIAAGGEYTASVAPKDGRISTESRSVQRRPQPGNPRITSSALGEVTFDFDRVSGMAYEVVSATHTTSSGAASLGITADHLTASSLSTAEHDTFNFSVKTLGDGMFYADSQTASAAETLVKKLSVPISPFFGGDQHGLTLNFDTTNNANAHIIAVQTLADGDSSWSEPVDKTVAAGDTHADFPTPGAGAQVRFSVTAKAANALQADSDTVTSPTLSVVQLASATGLDVVDLDSGEKARFEFDAVAGADRYTIAYTLSDHTNGSVGPFTHTAATSATVALDSGVTVSRFDVTAHAALDATHVYLDSTASYLAP